MNDNDTLKVFLLETAMKKIFYLLCFSNSLQAQNIKPRTQYSTVFFHGLNAGPVQAAKYIPEHNSSITGERVTCTKGINVLYSPITAPTMSEFCLSSQPRSSFWRTQLIAIKQWLYTRKHMQPFGITVHPAARPESIFTLLGYVSNIFKNNFGQTEDIEKLRKAYEEHSNRYPDLQQIAYGSSRGAATTFSFICQHKPPIAAAVFDGCFDSISSVLHKRYSWILGQYASMILESILQFTTTYQKTGPSPLALAHKWPTHVPALFITLKKDTEVPADCTRNLIQAIKKHNPNAQVYLLVLPNAAHPDYASGSDKELYEDAVHAFYKKQGIPCNETKANRGLDSLITM